MRLQTEFREQFLDGEAMMSGDGLEDAAEQCANFQWFVVRHGDMMGAIDLSREPDVRTFGSHPFVTQHPQRVRHCLA